MSHLSKLKGMAPSIKLRAKPNGTIGVKPLSVFNDPEINGYIYMHKDAILRELKTAHRIVSSKKSLAVPPMARSTPQMGDLAKQLIKEKVPKILLNAFEKQLESKDHGGCGCKDMQTRMNQAGPEKIDSDRKPYVEHFGKQIGMLPGGSLLPGKWRESAAEHFIDQLMDMVKPDRYAFPEDTIVITACDQRFLPGAYFLAWTLLHCNDVRLRVYDLGINSSSRMVRDMRSWGVEFAPFQHKLKMKEYVGCETLNKPKYILHAMQHKEIVLWIDSDVAVAGSLEEMERIARDEPFVADHGFHIPTNKNPKELYTVMPKPAQRWGTAVGKPANYWPCAGILGFRSSRDREWVQKWEDQIAEADKKDLLGLYKFYDQGVFQDVYAGRLVDGKKWNNLKGVRSGPIEQVFAQLKGTDSVIVHYGGMVKPWQDWEIVSWPDPAYVKERHDRNS